MINSQKAFLWLYKYSLVQVLWAERRPNTPGPRIGNNFNDLRCCTQPKYCKKMQRKRHVQAHKLQRDRHAFAVSFCNAKDTPALELPTRLAVA